jgi:hypothetical protein
VGKEKKKKKIKGGSLDYSIGIYFPLSSCCSASFSISVIIIIFYTSRSFPSDLPSLYFDFFIHIDFISCLFLLLSKYLIFTIFFIIDFHFFLKIISCVIISLSPRLLRAPPPLLVYTSYRGVLVYRVAGYFKVRTLGRLYSSAPCSKSSIAFRSLLDLPQICYLYQGSFFSHLAAV